MHILITGASKGIGRAIAIKAASSGMFDKIIINSRSNEAGLEETAQLAGKASESENLIIHKSLGDLGSISYVRRLREEIGPVDVLINNAAVSYVGLLVDMTPEEWSESINTNLSSIYNTCHTFLPDMIAKQSGHIINISSVWGEAGASCEVVYSATKGAINSFTRALAKEVGPSGIQVNAIAPGIVDTEMNSHLSAEELSEICEDIPMGRMAKADEIADAAINILRMPRYLTGEIIRIDGGWI